MCINSHSEQLPAAGIPSSRDASRRRELPTLPFALVLRISAGSPTRKPTKRSRPISLAWAKTTRFRLTERLPLLDPQAHDARESLAIGVKRRHTAFKSKKAACVKPVCGPVRGVMANLSRLFSQPTPPGCAMFTLPVHSAASSLRSSRQSRPDPRSPVAPPSGPAPSLSAS